MKHPETLPAIVPGPTVEDWRQVLWDAAAWMETHGWQPNSKGCVIRAMFEVSGSVYNDTAEDALIRQIGTDYIPGWSDASDQATVVAALRSAAVSS